MIEYLRNNVIVRLMCFSRSLPFEGNRRIETKFQHETISALKSTLQRGHSRDSYARALRALADLYVKLRNGMTKKFRFELRLRESRSVRKVLAARRL
jgi:hypothetical protein